MRTKVNPQPSSDAVGLVKVKVCVPVDTVALTELPTGKSIASVPPPRSPRAFVTYP